MVRWVPTVPKAQKGRGQANTQVQVPPPRVLANPGWVLLTLIHLFCSGLCGGVGWAKLEFTGLDTHIVSQLLIAVGWYPQYTSFLYHFSINSGTHVVW